MLPSYSLTRQAILHDPEAVEEMRKAGVFDKKPTEQKIAVSEATPEVQALYDILLELRMGNHLARQGKGRVEPTPKIDMPLVDEAKRKADQDEYDRLKGLFGGQPR